MTLLNPDGTAAQTYKNGVCPIMSGQIVIDAANRPVMLPQPCLGEQCQLWSDSLNRCSLIALPYLADAVKYLEPATGPALDQLRTAPPARSFHTEQTNPPEKDAS